MQEPTPNDDSGRLVAGQGARSNVERPPVAHSPPALRAAISVISEAVLVCDREDRVRIVNPAADRLFAGRPVQDADDLLSRFERVPGAAVPEGGPVMLRERTAAKRWFELRTFPVDPGGSPVTGLNREDPADGGRIIVLRDVTVARAARAERRAFLSILSHELRTPITTIYAGSRVLARHAAGQATNGTREIARDISAEAARLYDVVEDLLVLTRAEQSLLELSEEPILLQRVVESAIRVARGRRPDVPIVTAGVKDPPAVQGDGVYVDQVVRNLVTAATRFGGPSVPVVVTLDEGDREVSLEVLDGGPDLSRAELETSFALTDDSAARTSGLAIGLFVCRRLVEAMKGRVWVRAREGGGAAFGFALPRYEPD
jgi:signal transduction histidine kinase